MNGSSQVCSVGGRVLILLIKDALLANCHSTGPSICGTSTTSSISDSGHGTWPPLHTDYLMSGARAFAG